MHERIMDERLTKVLNRLDVKSQPDRSYSKLHKKPIRLTSLKFKPQEDIRQLLVEGPLKKIEHSLRREAKKNSQIKDNQYKKERTFIPVDRDEEQLLLLSRKAQLFFSRETQKHIKREYKFSDEDLKKKMRRRIEKMPGAIQGVTHSFIHFYK